MKLARLEPPDLAVVLDDVLVPIGEALIREGALRTPSMVELIANYPSVRPLLEQLLPQLPRVPLAGRRLAAPVDCPSKIWAAAANYRRGTSRASDQLGRGEAPSTEGSASMETAFLKPPSAIIGPCQAIIIPADSSAIFHELELCVVIGRRVSRLSPQCALDAVFGYTVMLDITARPIAAGHNLAATRCVRKGFDTFAPLGPWIVTSDEICDPQRLAMRLYINHELVQIASTHAMFNGVAAFVSFLSQVSTLYPGDLIATGNPDAPEFQRRLKPGDLIEAEIEKIGVLQVTVAS